MRKSISLKNVFILILFISASTVNAQLGMGKLEDIQKLKEVPLLVVLESPNEKVVKKLTKKDPEGLKKYYADIESNNNVLKTTMPNNWGASKEIRFIEREEFEKFNDKKNKGKYSFFKPVVYDRSRSKMSTAGLMVTYSYAVYISGDKSPVYSMMYGSENSDVTVNEADLKFICQQMQNYFTYREQLKGKKKSKKELVDEMYKNAEILSQKTVLLDKNDLKKEVIEEIDNIYKFKYKMATKAEIDQAILNEDENYAYLKIMPVGQITSSGGAFKASKLLHAQYFMNAKDGKVLTMITPTPIAMPGLLGTAMKSSNNKVSKKDLDKVVSRIEKSK
jgi:hypothetical protein